MSDLTATCRICNAFLDEEDLFCSNCGKSAEQLERDTPPAGAVFTHNFGCVGCGASMSYDASAQSLQCPYCGSKKLEKRADQKGLSPSKVIPFRLAAADAQQLLRKWLGQGFWRPSDLSSKASVDKMNAVYVPYWVFSATTHTYWTADTGDTPRGARADWYPVTGENRGRYAGLLVGASSVLKPDETSQICPFDMAQAVAVGQVDLHNANVEQFSVPRKYARPLAREGLEESERRTCAQRYLGSSRHRNLKVNVRIGDMKSEPVLLPVWVIAYRYRQELYRILINGQSGRITGDAPFSWLKLAAVLAIAAIILLLALAFAAMQ